MSTIVIGDADGSHIVFNTGARETDPHDGADYLPATGSFRVPSLQGEFATRIYLPVGQGFARDIERMTDTLAGELAFRTGKEHLADVEMSIKISKLGQVSVDAKVNHQPRNVSQIYWAEFGFDIDQSYLPALLSALKIAFPVQR